jgi:hypothetical protein
MSILNRRNAALGWLAWRTGRTLLAYKKGEAKSRRRGGSKGSTALKIGAVAAAAGGAFVFWKVKHRDSTDHDSVASEDLGTPAASEDLGSTAE